METPKHQILGRLELSALLIEWGTMWSGSMIFRLDESKPSDKGFAVTLTVVVILTNTALLICFVVQFIRAKMNESKEEARLTALAAAAAPSHERKESCLSAAFLALRTRFGSNVGEVEMISFENPMESQGVKNEIKKKKRQSRMKKIRKKLSVGARVKRTSHGAGSGGSSTGGEAKTVSDVEAAVSYHVDEETGNRYSYDPATGQTQWLSADDEEEESTIEEQGEKKQESSKRQSFRKIVNEDNAVFFQNVETGENVWNMPKNGDLVAF